MRSGPEHFSQFDEAVQLQVVGPRRQRQQGAAFRRMLSKGYAFYRSIGTKRMTAKRVETTKIDATHCMAKVFYCAEYRKPDGSEVRLEFDVTYFLDVTTTRPKIFGFVSGDEMGLYRQHGLLPQRPEERPRPRPRPASPWPAPGSDF